MSFRKSNGEFVVGSLLLWIKLIGIAGALAALLVFSYSLFAADPTPIPVPTPDPAPTDPTTWLDWLQSQPTAEIFWLSEYEMPDGDTRLAERVVQVPGAGCSVVSTRGYIQGPGGYWNQGFVETEVVAWFTPFSFLEGIAWAGDKDKGTVKKSHKWQAKLEKKPSKLKKINWTKAMEIKW